MASRTGLFALGVGCAFAVHALVACGASGGQEEDGADEDGPPKAASPSKTRDGGRSSTTDGASSAPAGERPSAGCAAPKFPAGTDRSLKLKHDGIDRTFLLKVGDAVDASKPSPLWLDWHGLGSTSTMEKLYSGSASLADERGFVVAYPQGLGDAFNAGVCCSDHGSPPHDADDIGFARTIVEALGNALCIDLDRVYSLGMSNGGYMSEYNACEGADLFAAVAPVSALGVTQSSCAPSRAVPMIAFNGTADDNVSYAGSRESIEAWRTRNDCQGAPKKVAYGDSYCETWKCAADTELTSCTVTGMNHCWPGNTLALPDFCASGGLTDIDATPMIADFFARFRLPR